MSRPIREPGMFAALLPLVAMFIFVIVGYGIYDVKIELLIIGAAIVAGIVAVRMGHTWDEIQNSMSEKLMDAMPATLILIAVGLLIGTWVISGTIPMMVYYGLILIDPAYLYITAFLVTLVISSSTGTSFGAAGTIGVALMGVAAGLGYSLPITAGAVISGAYFGDKMSPLSDTTNMASIASGAPLYTHIRHMTYTSFPSFGVCAIAYLIIGFMTDPDGASGSNNVPAILSALDAGFSWSLLLLLPPAIVMYGSVAKKPTLLVMLSASGAAILLAVTFQNFTLQQTFIAATEGFDISMISSPLFDADTVVSDVPTLLNRGGLYSMLNTVLFVICAFFFGAALDVSGALTVIVTSLLKVARSIGNIILSTIVSGLILVSATSNASITMLIVADLFRDAYKARRLKMENMSRTMEDSVSIFECLLPWSVSGIYMSTTLGVPTFEYAPWAIFCYSGIFFALLYGYGGRMFRFALAMEPETSHEVAVGEKATN
jgi:Na+:H+ antiporter, NhaC family